MIVRDKHEPVCWNKKDNRKNEAAIGVVDRLDDCLCSFGFFKGPTMAKLSNLVSGALLYCPTGDPGLFDISESKTLKNAV